MAAVVATCGIISFVGIIVPYIARAFLGSDHPRLIPSATFIGGGFLIICDTVSRIIIAPSELPVGIVTALIGGPFFLWILTSKHNKEIIFSI